VGADMERTKAVMNTSISKRDNYIHIETFGCIVNIYPYLEKNDGRRATTVEILADQEFKLEMGHSLSRVVEKEKT
jgi:hypothetical protein